MNNQQINHQKLNNDVEPHGKLYDQVLISIANPETAEQSVQLACYLTEKLSVLHIINVTKTAPFAERAASWRKSSQLVIEMTRLANRLDRDAKPLATTADSIPDSIISTANSIGADLVILGWFGQVTPLAVRKSHVVRRVLDKARCDTIVLKSRNPIGEAKRLVVPIHRNYSRKRLALAQSIMERQDIPVLLVHVLSTDSNLNEQEAQELLNDSAQRLGDRVQTQIVNINNVVEGVLSVVNENDVIIVGPGREWVFKRFLFGHNADQLANDAPCSVLMYKAKERKLTAWFWGLVKTIRQRMATNKQG